MEYMKMNTGVIVILSVAALMIVGCYILFVHATKDIRSMKAGCVVPDDVHPEIVKLLTYLKANGVSWSGYSHDKKIPASEVDVVDMIYLYNVSGKGELDALDVRLEKSEASAKLWLTPQDKPESEQEDIWAVNGCLAVDIQFIGEKANRIKRLIEEFKK
jgi:hypothetical protein